MADKAEGGLQHIRSASALSPGSMRSGIVARGRRDAAASATNPHYQAALGEYSLGNFAAAAASFRLAGYQGHAESQYLLSTMLEAGKAVPEDVQEAALWEIKAAEQGHAYAQANVSFRCYSAGDFEQAFLWCQRAAQTGLAWAQFHLGLMYRKGEGIARSDTEAAHWYGMAAHQGSSEAQAKLGGLYSLGLGVPQSFSLAASWYGRAAMQGHAEAQYQLGQCYGIGQGVEQDYIQARHWIRLAAQQGHKLATHELHERGYRDA